MVKKYFGIAILVFLLLASYDRFQSYDPNISEIEEVKGIAAKKEIIPYPKESEITSENYTEEFDQVTIKTNLEYKKISEFYKNILLESGWRLKEENTNEIFNTLQFKKNKTTITIVSTIKQEEDKTILSIHSERN